MTRTMLLFFIQFGRLSARTLPRGCTWNLLSAAAKFRTNSVEGGCGPAAF